jgi:ADP-heptose:LPS heptosyltransferase
MCWHQIPWIEDILTLPVSYEVFKRFPHLAMFEVVSNADEHPDQLHTTDSMLEKIGFDLTTLSAEDRVVLPSFSPKEVNEAQGLFPDKDIAIYQLTSASPTRSFTPADSAYYLEQLTTAFPQWHWVAIHDGMTGEAYKTEVAKKLSTNVTLYRSPNLRVLWAMTRRAKVVVAPDSMMVHVAGMEGVPCVGIWGPISPVMRARYYKNHVAIWAKENCPNAPCFCYSVNFPNYCPPTGVGPKPPPRATCEVISSISPSDVIDAVREVVAAEGADTRSSPDMRIWQKQHSTTSNDSDSHRDSNENPLGGGPIAATPTDRGDAVSSGELLEK